MKPEKVSKTAIVTDCQIGEGTVIWHFTNLYGCDIGKNCTIGSFVEIQNGASIGDSVTISSHSFICSLVRIESDVFVGHGVMTINDVHPPSLKRTGDKSAWKQTIVKSGAVIGTNSTLMPVTIGRNAIVGAGSVVLSDVPDNAVVVGNPAKIIN